MHEICEQIVFMMVSSLQSQYSPYLPLAIFGSCTFISACLTILLRDTRDDATPETVGEMDLKYKRKYLFEAERAKMEKMTGGWDALYLSSV